MSKEKTHLFVLPNEMMGGAEQVIKQLATHLVAQKLQADVIVLTGKQTIFWDTAPEIRIHRVKAGSVYSGLIKSFGLIYSLSRKNAIELAFSSQTFINAWLGLLRALHILKTKALVIRESTTVFSRFSGPKLWLYKAAYFVGYGQADLIICQTEKMKSELEESNPQIRGERIKVIANPLDLKFFEKKDYGFPDGIGTEYIVTAGRLIPVKGFDVLIEAFYKMHSEFPEYKLVILGEGSEREHLQSMIDRYGMHDHVILKGFVDDPVPYFRYAKVCVVSSLMEGFPNVLLQMMSQNNKVVSTRCAGGIEDIKGLVVANPGRVDELYHSLKMVIEQDTLVNRALFDEELSRRSINHFMRDINGYIKN